MKAGFHEMRLARNMKNYVNVPVEVSSARWPSMVPPSETFGATKIRADDGFI